VEKVRGHYSLGVCEVSAAVQLEVRSVGIKEFGPESCAQRLEEHPPCTVAQGQAADANIVLEESRVIRYVSHRFTPVLGS
jgi:hypothetical protein